MWRGLVYYVLDEDGHVIEIDDVLAWAAWFETGNRTVARSQVGPYLVSTIFLGLDHGFSLDPDAPPILWETMVFAGVPGLRLWPDLDCRRYSSREEAIEGHRTTCQLVALEIERQEGALPAIVEVPVKVCPALPPPSETGSTE